MNSLQTSERIEVTGIVQGVGFRPFVHRLATELGLDGVVGNNSRAVFIEVDGPTPKIDTFVDRLRTEAPPLAHITAVTRRLVARGRASGFSIVESEHAEGARALVSPDIAMCDDCRAELFDSSDRRCGHPFITCTNCGPRFTIIETLPYDRPNTTMAPFAMCDTCRAEYEDPVDRRYHAQPIACHDCGPRLSLRSAVGDRTNDDPVADAAALIAAGSVVAIKGLGGYHLACDARNGGAVERLRTRKHRPDKPFAVMVRDLAQAQQIAHVSPAEAALLRSPQAPIVLIPARSDTNLSARVAPDNPLVGVMVAYTPLHVLLLEAYRGPLVMTSANRSGEPLAYNPSMLEELDDLFDAVLDHDRVIGVPCDDSVVRVVAGRLMPIRRARGYAPIPVALSAAAHTVLAVGGDLKNTFCIAAGGHAWVSQHIGDMENLETLRAFERSVDHFSTMYGVEPAALAADAHPGYVSGRWAREDPRPVQVVQHHHAHIASAMAEHGVAPDEPVIGFAFDGTGYGNDATIWGGELLIANAHGFERAAHLEAFPLPGGDRAIRHPWRVALALLHTFGIEWAAWLPPMQSRDPIELAVLRSQLANGLGCVPTSSMGRLFDAVASLVGLRHAISFEAQAAIDLEFAAISGQGSTEPYRFGMIEQNITTGPVIRAIVADLETGASAEVVAWRFHEAVAELVHRLAIRMRSQRGIGTVVLTGGVFQNAVLYERCLERLQADDFTTLSHHLVPANDGGLSLGQAFVAAQRAIDQTPFRPRRK